MIEHEVPRNDWHGTAIGGRMDEHRVPVMDGHGVLMMDEQGLARMG